jgi:hypothetical protein
MDKFKETAKTLFSASKKFEHASKKLSFESSAAFSKRKKIIDGVKSLKGKAGNASIRARRQLAIDELERLMSDYKWPKAISARFKFLTEQSNHIIAECSFESAGGQSGLAKRTSKGLKAEALKAYGKKYKAAANELLEQSTLAKKEAEALNDKIEVLERSSIPRWGACVELAVEIVNVILAGNELTTAIKEHNSDKAMLHTIELTATLFDSAEAFSDVMETCADLKNNIKFPIGRCLGGIASIYDIIGCSKEISDCLDGSDKVREIWGLAITCVADALNIVSVGAEVYCFVAGIILEESVFLSALAGPIGLAATVLFLLGALISYLLRPRPYKEWAEQSPWTKETPFNLAIYEKLSKIKIDDQLQKLFQVLTTFEITPKIFFTRYQVYGGDQFAFDSVGFEIECGVMNPKISRFLISTEIKYRDVSVLKAPTLIVIQEEKNAESNPQNEAGKPIVEKTWNLDQIESLAKQGNYYSRDLEKLCNRLRVNRYYRFDGVTEDQKAGSFRDDQDIEISYKVRLDYDGKFDHNMLDRPMEGTGVNLFPIKGPIHKNNHSITEYSA